MQHISNFLKYNNKKIDFIVCTGTIKTDEITKKYYSEQHTEMQGYFLDYNSIPCVVVKNGSGYLRLYEYETGMMMFDLNIKKIKDVMGGIDARVLCSGTIDNFIKQVDELKQKYQFINTI